MSQRARRDAGDAGADAGRGVARRARGAGGHAVARRAQPGRHLRAVPQLHRGRAAARAPAAHPAVPGYVLVRRHSW